MIEIESIEGVAVQGITQPLICTASDGHRYFVKYVEAATCNGLFKEWASAHIAKELGLNIPDFKIAFLPQVLIDIYPGFQNGLVDSPPKEGIVFASKALEAVDEFKLDNRDDVPIEEQKDLLVFDLWVRNEDRNLSRLGGNVNLLWSVLNKQMVVIDHNLVFENMITDDFMKNHIFRPVGNEIFSDMYARDDYQQKLQKVLEKWDNFVSSCPEDWLDTDCFTLDLDAEYQRLLDDANGQIWDTLK